MAAPLGMTSIHDSVVAFLNTVAPKGGRSVDLLESDESALRWLESADIVVKATDEVELDGLSWKARSLRESIRDLLTQRKRQETVDIDRLNAIMGHGRYWLQLVEDEPGHLRMVRKFEAGAPEQLLAPLAIAAAHLLAKGDLRAIRKCEGDNCPVWFYDKTRAHRRRWCDMALCGNRQKVARFRSRRVSE